MDNGRVDQSAPVPAGGPDRPEVEMYTSTTSESGLSTCSDKTSGQMKSDHVVVVDSTSKVPQTQDTMEPGRLKLLICFLGVFISYFIYGLLQEKITKGRYGENKEKFTYTMALVFVQTIINALFAKIVMSFYRQGEDTIPMKQYALMTFFYVGAMVASNHSLQYVSYPTQVLGKSVKPIPVMILGVLIAHKRYPVAKYLFVLMIVMGVAIFLYKDKKSGALDSDHAFGFGEILLLISLTMDGLTGAMQDKMRANYRFGTHSMMLFTNLFSILYLGVGLVVSGEGLEFLAFATKYPVVLFNMVTFSLASAVGQNFIFMTVTNFGPLMCSIITTTRKFFTILASVIIFGHPMLQRQWAGTVLVFVGLGLDSAYGKEVKKPKVEKKQEK